MNKEIDILLEKIRRATELGYINAVIQHSKRLELLNSLCPECDYYFGKKIYTTKLCDTHKKAAQ